MPKILDTLIKIVLAFVCGIISFGYSFAFFLKTETGKYIFELAGTNFLTIIISVIIAMIFVAPLGAMVEASEKENKVLHYILFSLLIIVGVFFLCLIGGHVPTEQERMMM